MAQNNATDEAPNGTEFTVAVACDCPKCGSENTATTENTAELFTDEDGYSSRCDDCGFWFRANELAENGSEDTQSDGGHPPRNFTRRTRAPSTGDRNQIHHRPNRGL